MNLQDLMLHKKQADANKSPSEKSDEEKKEVESSDDETYK